MVGVCGVRFRHKIMTIIQIKTMTQTEQLNELINQIKKPIHYDWTARYVPRKGWYIFPDTPRSYDENGEYMGYTLTEAKKSIQDFLK
jgi:hypothetical protein